MRRVKIMRGALVAVVAMILGVACPLNMMAQAVEIPAERIQTSTLKITPELNPGDVYASHMTIQNTGTDTFKFKVSASPYSVQDDTYDNNFDQMSDHTQIANWITFAWDTAELAPNQSIDVPFTITVPKDVPAGGQYGAVTAEIVHDSQTAQTGVQAQYRLAMLIFATVNGDTRVTGSISENNINSMFLNPPLSATSRVENTGNVHADEKITLEVNNFFGNDEVYSNANNPETHTLLPGTRRYNIVYWDDAPAIGLFKVKQTVEFIGQKNVNEVVVLMCPLWLIILILAIIAGVIILIVFRCRGNKQDKKPNKIDEE